MEFEPYEIPLREPLPGSGEVVRRGFYLKWDGRLGEAAPLPGWSRETLAEAEADLRGLAAGKPPEEIRTASVRFAWECAEQERNGWRDYPLRAREIPLNALGGDLETKLAAGCRCFKFKVAGEPRKMAAWVRAQAEQIAGRAALRLDANRAWTEAEARTFLEGIADVDYQYLEEPVRTRTELRNLLPDARLAFDETLREISPLELLDWPGIRAVVLKPTLLGGLAISDAFARAAAELGAVAVVSSSFESEVGLRALARFAASLSDAPEPAGLDTGRWLGRPEPARWTVPVA